jgi:predicted transcriptional regulator
MFSEEANSKFLDLTTEIVAAHISNNSMSATDVPALIKSVHSALSELGQGNAQPEPELRPAVSIRSSVKPDGLVCLECGAKMKMLKRHLSTDHGLTAAEYRQRWSLASDYPIVAPAYAEQRRALAIKIGLGRKPAAKPVVKRTRRKPA